MPIERTAHFPQPQTRQRADRPACLDCPMCAGLCWSLAELDRLPEVVLHSDRTVRA